MINQQVPLATYRLQFDRHFRFREARRLVPYLHRLGITHLYASPLLRARGGSPHGYDVADPTCLNPELGTSGEFELLCDELKRHGMSLLLDIVPNHMSASSENRWWMDVLKNGPGSRFASYFDIDWQHPKQALRGKVLLPILGAPYGAVLENQQLVLDLEEEGFLLRYGGTRLPVATRSYNRILRLRPQALDETRAGDAKAFRELRHLTEEIEHLRPGDSNPDHEPSRAGASDSSDGAVEQTLWRLYTGNRRLKALIDHNLRVFNGRKHDPSSFVLLDELLDEQAYWLSFWKLANEEINYRRFFAISDLVSLRAEDPAVFEATHGVVLRLVREGKASGLRIDHVDGLLDPQGYLERLHGELAGSGRPAAPPGPALAPYLVVEKILAAGESLPRGWPVCGTTGYEFLNALNRVFVDRRGSKVLDQTYARFIGARLVFRDIVYQSKCLVINTLFGGEIRSLGQQLGRLAEGDRGARDLPLGELDQALVEVTACFPIYRTYLRGDSVPPRDRRYIEQAMAEARRRNPSLSPQVLGFLGSVLRLETPPYLSAQQREARLRFVTRWQQFTGPVMAKGFEDTSLYIYNRLMSLNEVGGDPEAMGVLPQEFHRCMAARQVHWPYSLSSTSTHDTKRGEDARARINVLSEIPGRWRKRVTLWRRLNSRHVRTIDGRAAPDRNEEYLLYQTLLGAWPVEPSGVRPFRERLQGYVIKAAREAKVHTRWIRPDTRREKALVEFVQSILKPSARSGFLKDFLRFQKEVAFLGMLNGLGQVLLKIAAPGVPDFYQGTELWDQSLVDPDNRRPVDFAMRKRLLRELESAGQGKGIPLGGMLKRWRDGRVKLHVIAMALRFRRAHPELFLGGEYLPLEATGRGVDHLCAFARRWRGAWVLVAVPRLLSRLTGSEKFPLGKPVWGSGVLRLPGGSPKHWLNVLTGETIAGRPLAKERSLPLERVFHSFPLALLAGGSA